MHGDDQFANLSAPFQNANASWHTRVNQIIQLSKFPKFTIKLFTIRFKLGFNSGIIELVDAQFYGCFHLCKVKTSRLKQFAQFFQVRYQCWQKVSTTLKCFVFISRSETTHVASFLFFDRGLIQCSPKGRNLTPSSHCCLSRQPPCYACALQLPTFCLHCSLMHRQASRSQRRNS